MKLFLSFIFFIFTFSSGKSQVPGYLGKKIMVGYNFNANLASKTELLISFVDAPTIFLATKHEGYTGFSISDKLTVLVDYIYQNNKTYHKVDDLYYEDRYIGKSYNKVYTNVIDFGMRIHLRKFIAPVGTYLDISYGICKTGFAKNDSKVYFYEFPNGNRVNYELNGEGSSLKYNRLSLGIGNTKVIRDLFFFNIGFKVNFNFNFESNKNTSAPNYSEKMVSFLKYSVRPMNWSEIKIGFGILF